MQFGQVWFQFLIGTLKTADGLPHFRIVSRVSIPDRYAKNSDLKVCAETWHIVSIPDRYAKNRHM